MIFRILQQASNVRADRSPVNKLVARVVNRAQGLESGQVDYMKVLSSEEFTRFNVYCE